ncbi:MAG: type transport system ATP-binding protein [Actinomycetota bacterium]|nr:type transport system ATP-binding protein [Actinomycetota bacterium]
MTGVVGRGLRKTYGATTALDGVDLDVPRGSVHGLLGPNGAGKSTLLRALLGLVRLDAGTIELDGVVAGFVEVPGAYPYLTGRRNLEVLTRLDDHPGDVEQALAQVDLTDRADTKVAGWSLGMRQRLAIAAALLRAPDVLLLDEPANGLDPRAARGLRDLVRQLADSGITALLSSHDLSEVDAVCDDVTVLVAGRVAWSGTMAELRARPGRHRITTSDDPRALAMPSTDLAVEAAADGGLLLHGTIAAVDAFVLALAREQIAVRSLAPASLALEEAFLELTS